MISWVGSFEQWADFNLLGGQNNSLGGQMLSQLETHALRPKFNVPYKDLGSWNWNKTKH